MNLIRPIFFILILLCATLQAELIPLYVQSSAGSFNDQAVHELLQDTIDGYNLIFCGTPENAMQLAAENNALAFCALKNSTLPGQYVTATLTALTQYAAPSIEASHVMLIEMATLQHQDAVAEGVPLRFVASHPAALLQITQWKALHPSLVEIETPDGTADAARQLSEGELPLRTTVIGPKTLTNLYTNLIVVEEAIQDLSDNFTTFILFYPTTRPSHVSTETAIAELNALGL